MQGLGSDQVHEFLLARARVFHVGSEGFSDTALADDSEESRVCRGDFSLQDERGLHLGAGRGREAQGLTARPDGRREGRGAAGDQEEETVSWRLFQCFQQGVGRADRHAVCIVDQADFPLADERPIHDLMFDLADLFDLDLLGGLFRIRFDDEKVRMGAGLDLLAGPAGAATVEAFCFWRPFAAERLRETNRRQSFPDRLLAMEQVGVSQSLMGDGSL